MRNRTLLRVGTDAANVTDFANGALQILLAGYTTEFIYLPDFWEDDGTPWNSAEKNFNFN